MGHQETRSAKRPQRRTTGDFAKKKTLYHLSLCQQGRHSYNKFEELEKMRAFLVFALAASATAQLKFGSDPTEAPKKDVNTRLGLLCTSRGLSPTAEQTSGSSSRGGQSSAFTQGSGQTPTGRVPSGGEFTGSFSSCCCVPLSEQCGDPLGRDIDYDYDLVGSGLIDPRLKPLREESVKRTQSAKDGLGLRIVNRPNANTNSQINTCPIGQKACCYDPSVSHASFGRSCIALSPTANQFESVRYGCNEQVVNSGKQCGTRNFPAPARGLQHGEASPGEFPWTCLVLNQNNDFIGSCAVIPNDSSNNNGRGSRKVVTAAHKLKNVQQNELLKIRVGEYDASGFNPPRDCPARGVHYCQASEAPSVQCRKTEQRHCHPLHCCWTCHLGCWMRQRCAWSLCQDVTFHPVDRSELDLFICLNNFIREGNFQQFPSNKSLCVEA